MADRAVYHQDFQGEAGVEVAGDKGCTQKRQKLIRFPVLPCFAYAHQNHAFGGEQRMKPVPRVSRSPGDTQHLPYYSRRIRDMVQSAEFIHRVKASVRERKSISRHLQQRDCLGIPGGHPLLDESTNGLHPADQRSRERCRKVPQIASRDGSHVQQALNLHGPKD
jgi:hypothetical protein